MPRLMWFRSDLRLGDNRALNRACAAGEGVVGVFFVTPGQWARHDWGTPKVGFVLRSLADLSGRLGALNIPLRVVEVPAFAGVPGALVRLAKEVGATGVHANAEYEVNEIARDEAAVGALEGVGLGLHLEHDQTIGPVHEIRTGSGGFYTVYSPFRKAWEARHAEAGGWAAEAGPGQQPPVRMKADAVPERVAGFGAASIDWSLWPAGEVAARERLGQFIAERARAYKDERDLPGVEGTSTLSAYLSAGVISARECFDAALRANKGRLEGGSEGLVTWMRELVWREFYRHVLIGFPRVCRGRPFKAETESIRWNEDAGLLGAWREGRTGYPIVDAAMRQLDATGWMHNRLRMISAMFLSKDLLLDWRLGERHFMQRLVDADLAQNNGGWQWSASTGTDAAPYFRIFNPASQSRRFDSGGVFLRRWLPELASLDDEAIHDPSPLERERMGYPQPVVDHAAARDRAIAAFR